MCINNAYEHNPAFKHCANLNPNYCNYILCKENNFQSTELAAVITCFHPLS